MALTFFSLFASALFLLTVFIFYNSSALIYVIVYAVISIIGNTIGGVLKKV
jgi:ABC-type proline/glycine betaine transport system permease subunit